MSDDDTIANGLAAIHRMLVAGRDGRLPYSGPARDAALEADAEAIAALCELMPDAVRAKLGAFCDDCGASGVCYCKQ